MNISLGLVLNQTFNTAIKNIPSILGAALLWVITIWVPYINVGTTIALFYGMPLELSRGKVMNPTAIFDGKYRKYMGEFFSCIGLMGLSIIPALFFMIVPAIIIGIGWTFALLLLVDHEMNPAEAMTKSTQYTYGYKWMIFFSTLAIYIIYFVGAMILGWIAGAINVGFISFIVFLFIIALGATLSVALQGVLYRMLVLKNQESV